MGIRTVAIVSDVVMEYGGAEKVVECFLEMHNEATLYTLLMAPEARLKIMEKFPKVRIVCSPWQPFFESFIRSRYISLIKIFSWIYWELLDLSAYDLVISSSHSFMSKNVKKREGSFHLSYIHTPPRYLYDEFNEIQLINRTPIKQLFWPVKTFLRWIDKIGAARPDVLVSNSKNVFNRIEKYYQRKSVIVYPPVSVKVGTKKNGDYLVVVSRLVKQKGIDVSVQTCTNLGINLIVIGDGDERAKLEKIAGKTVRFVGRCNDTKKNAIISGARGLLYTSIDEDFGIVPVEALKLGIPVIAFNSGGVRETVVNGLNGILFDALTVSGMSQAIKRFDGMKFEAKECQKSVSQFGNEKFKKQISNLILRNERID